MMSWKKLPTVGVWKKLPTVGVAVASDDTDERVMTKKPTCLL